MNVIRDRERLLLLDNYPGMVPAESRVLRQFIRRHGDRFDEWRFNVRIGEGVKLGDEFEPALRRSFEAITKARPDTIAFKHPNRATAIEVKESWTNEAVWQLLSYRDLYVVAFPEHELELVGVAQFATPTARQLAQNQGIALYLYELPARAVDVGELATETEPLKP